MGRHAKPGTPVEDLRSDTFRPLSKPEQRKLRRFRADSGEPLPNGLAVKLIRENEQLRLLEGAVDDLLEQWHHEETETGRPASDATRRSLIALEKIWGGMLHDRRKCA